MAVARADYLVEPKQTWPEGAWPCFSPDGRRLVFTGDLKRPHSRLMSLPAVGGEEAQCITPPNINAKRPTWLHDGKEIVFNRDQNSIWTINLDDGGIEPFLHHAPPDLPSFVHPCAYPNERAVVVVGLSETANGRERVLYKLTPDATTPIIPLTTSPEVCAGRPGVSPDGKAVVFAGNAGRFDQGANQLWIVKADRKAQRLEQNERALAQGRAPRWSPDGKWIACTSTRPAPNPDERTPRAVWIISADGQEAHRLTDHSMNFLHVAWSPDQMRLACGGVDCGLALLDLPERFQAAEKQRT